MIFLGYNELDLCDADLIIAIETFLNEHVLKIPIKVIEIHRNEQRAAPSTIIKFESKQQDATPST